MAQATSKKQLVRKGLEDPTVHPLIAITKKGLSGTAETDRKGRLHAKEAGHCARNAAVSAMRSGVDVFSASSALYWSVGTAVHDSLKQAWEKQNILLYAELKMPDIGLNLGGYADALVMLNGEIHIVEVKTCGKVPTTIKPDHFSQAVLYSAIATFPSMVHYVSRTIADYFGNVQMGVISCNASPDDYRRVVFNAAYARLCADMKVMPTRPHFGSEKECGFCSLIPVCWHGEEPPFEQISPKQNALTIAEANAITKKILSKPEVAARRKTVIDIMLSSGTDFAKSVLSKNS